MKNEKGGTGKEREQRKPGEKRKRGNKGKRGTWLTRGNAGTRITRGKGKKRRHKNIGAPKQQGKKRGDRKNQGEQVETRVTGVKRGKKR